MIVKRPLTDVPVVVDAVRIYGDFSIARCNYLSIECDSPKEGWILHIGGEELPFLMLGLVGIVTSPFGAKRFNNVGLIEDLFRRIEDEADLLINVDDIWLPIFLFNTINMKPKVGQVYRVNSDIFALALSFREGRLELKTFLKKCQRLEQPLVLSEDEMRPFSEWHEMQVLDAKEHYPKNRKLVLPWHEGGHGYITPSQEAV